MLVIFCGPDCSGKSDLIKMFIEKHPEFRELKMEHFPGKVDYPAIEKACYSVNSLVRQLVKKGFFRNTHAIFDRLILSSIIYSKIFDRPERNFVREYVTHWFQEVGDEAFFAIIINSDTGLWRKLIEENERTEVPFEKLLKIRDEYISFFKNPKKYFIGEIKNYSFCLIDTKDGLEPALKEIMRFFNLYKRKVCRQ